MTESWYKGAPRFESKKSKSIIHSFIVKNYNGLTINPYQGCQHRCAYCYATYEWSPEFYDKIYAKSNAAEVLTNQLAKWKSETIGPVMVSSATDCYQPAELRYGLTRKCIQVMQKYNVPYYVFTKSSIIERDLELHRQYRHNCFIVWSVTTCDERIRRVLEPGTPPASRLFSAIKKFIESGVSCAVNIDPIIPLITDSDEELETLVNNCKATGLDHVFGALMRIRGDIWERMKMVIKLLGIQDGERLYRQIYDLQEPITSNYVTANKEYAQTILGMLETKVSHAGLHFGFPIDMTPKVLDRSHLGQTTLTGYLHRIA